MGFEKFFKNKKAVIKISSIILSLIAVTFLILFASGVFAGTHTSSASLEPEWSTPGVTNDYEVTITNYGPDTVDEVRIYRNMDYTNFTCEEKTGWELQFINTKQACHYIATASIYYIEANESDTFKFSATAPSEDPEECELLWKFETRDLNDMWLTIYDTTSIDSKAPDTIKNYGTPFYSDGTYDWITTSTPVTLTATDMSLECGIGVDKLYWRNTLLDIPDEDCIAKCEYQGEGVWNEVDGNEITIYKEEESCHLIEYYSIDKLENEEQIINRQCVFVDDTPPVGIKEIGEPNIPCRDEEECGEFDYWVRDHITPITLDCEDQYPHPVNNEEVCYKVSYDLTPFDLTNQYCDGIMDDGWCCQQAPKTIIFEEDSLHDLEYFCRDGLGNTNKTIDLEWFKVDSQPPIITKEMIGDEHLGNCPPTSDGDVCYVADNGENGVSIDVEDNETYPECAVDEISCRYELWWNTDIDTCIKEFGGTHLYNPDTSQCFVEGGSFDNYKEIIFTEDSNHTLKIRCEDALGNEAYDEEEFLVDSTPPVTKKWYEGPQYPNPIFGEQGETPYPHWINSQTLVYLNATDNKVGVNTYWRNTLVDNKYCWTYDSGDCINAEGEGNFTEYLTPFTKPQESCHLIEYYSVDKLGNDERYPNGKYIGPRKQCVFVDNTAPLLNKTVGQLNIPCGEGEDCDYYINQETPIYLSCEDQSPHPVDRNILYWRDYLEGNEPPQYTIEESGRATIYKQEDSRHVLESYCEDGLGNEGELDREIFVVDTKAPVIEKEIIGPQWGNCPPEPNDDLTIISNGDGYEDCYIDGVTNISVNAEDPQPHPVNDVKCEWDYKVIDGNQLDEGEEGLIPPFIIHFPEESTHILTIICRDALGNEIRDIETFIVDKTPPITEKWYGSPVYPEEGYPKWITSETPIYLKAIDNGTHKSGIKEINYRYSLVSDEYCQNQELCQEYNGIIDKQYDTTTPILYGDYDVNFTIDEESCHLIEYYSVDNVNKTENVKRQCVFVDNTPPRPVKEVGEPKTIWDGKDSVFYKDETKNCWINGEGRIECWKVTLDTNINMSCIDPDPHPVDHEKICFNVGLDNDDETEEYCNEYNNRGYETEYNESGDGFCCLDKTIQDFKFLESSEHNLKFYCVDVLGNTNKEIDEEKFKVDGEDFIIELNKKWNLISTPVVLLNDDISEVFEDIANDVESVWAYDPLGELCESDDGWCVYSPDEDSPDNLLKTMQPGWGYWVLALNDTELLIGGSLLAPGRTPPNRNLIPGWNLIGYYGTEELDGYYGPNEGGDDAYSALYSLTSGELGLAKWNALYGYWEPNNPQFKGYNVWDNLDPGAGYWISMKDNQQNYIYSPSTVGCASFWSCWV